MPRVYSPRYFTKGSDLVRAQIEMFARNRLSLEDAFEDTVRKSLADHLELLSGDMTQETLDKLGNPFGRGPVPQKRGDGDIRLSQRGAARNRQLTGGRRRVRPLPINEQDGVLKRSVSLARLGFGAYDIDVDPGDGRIWVVTEGGTRYMVDRGYAKEVRRRNAARLKAFSLVYADIMGRP